MHPYSNDSSRTRTVMLVLAITAILLAWILGHLLGDLDVTPPWWLDTPAVVGFYGILWHVYDRFVWRICVGRQTLSGIPNYNGTWAGFVRSSHGGSTTYVARLSIRQTSTRIVVALSTDQSRSWSHTAMLCGGLGSGQGLQYIYANWPRNVQVPAPAAPQSYQPTMAMYPHEGVSRLLLRPDGTIDGDYQTDRHRGTHGTLSFKERVGS
jgi:SMODS-associating 2TM, beta-strand rich effector domain